MSYSLKADEAIETIRSNETLIGMWDGKSIDTILPRLEEIRDALSGVSDPDEFSHIVETECAASLDNIGFTLSQNSTLPDGGGMVGLVAADEGGRGITFDFCDSSPYEWWWPNNGGLTVYLLR